MFAVAEKECEFVELTKDQWEAVKDNNPLTWGLPALLHNGKQVSGTISTWTAMEGTRQPLRE